MVEYLAPPSYRFLGTRGFVNAADLGNCLIGINTTPVMDGAIVYVSSNHSHYYLDKTSVADPLPVDETIVAPLTGPGRWIALVGGSSSSAIFTGMVQLQGNAGFTITVASQNTWVEATNAPFDYTNAAPANTGGALFLYTAPSPALTYNGPDRLYKIWCLASIGASEGTPGNFEALEIAPDLNGVLIGTTTDVAYAQREAISDGPDVIDLTALRIVTLTDGDVINMALRNVSSSHDIDVAYFTLLLEPVI